MNQFAEKLINWQRQHGRHNLPWQTSDPYRVWLSEIMLQQTQVATVLEYYPKFINRFPDVQSLAEAEQDAVLQLWAGLGYYSRARNLHKAAQQIVHEFGGQFPQPFANAANPIAPIVRWFQIALRGRKIVWQSCRAKKVLFPSNTSHFIG